VEVPEVLVRQELVVVQAVEALGKLATSLELFCIGLEAVVSATLQCQQFFCSNLLFFFF